MLSWLKDGSGVVSSQESGRGHPVTEKSGIRSGFKWERRRGKGRERRAGRVSLKCWRLCAVGSGGKDLGRSPLEVVRAQQDRHTAAQRTGAAPPRCALRTIHRMELGDLALQSKSPLTHSGTHYHQE